MFTNSIAISGAPLSVTGSNVGATMETGEKVTWELGGKSIWWSWTAKTNGYVLVDTVGSTFDTVLGVFQGSALNTLGLRARDDDKAGNFMSFLKCPVSSNAVYHFCIGGYNPSINRIDPSAASGTVVLNIRPDFNAPAITGQPGGVTNIVGSALSLSVIASGAPTYQWFKDGAPIQSAMSSTYSVPSAQVSDSGTYWVEVGNAGGSVLSSNATVVIGAVVVQAQPKSQTVATGYPVTFTVGASGTTPPAYQWQKNGLPIEGATKTAYTIPAVQFSDQALYSVLAMTDQGSALSSNAVLTVVSPYTFGTVAGGRPQENASVDGIGFDARLHSPSGIARDPSGNLYVTEYYNATVCRITPQGLVTRIAGAAGQAGTNDGIGVQAQFDCPEGIEVDANTNLFVADNYNHTIRKMTMADQTGTNWIVTTLAGVPDVVGWQDGPGYQAQFSQPSGLTLDKAGNIYVTEWRDGRVRKITPDGFVTTVAGSKAGLSGPNNVVLDTEGNLYVTCQNSDSIVRITPGGIPKKIAVAVGHPYGGAIDARGDFYLAGAIWGTHSVRKLNADGQWTTLAGTDVLGFADGVGSQAQFYSLRSHMLVDSDGCIYVADSNNTIIRKGLPYAIPEAPRSQAVLVGTEVMLRTEGLPGSSYQWAFYDQQLPGQTTTNLNLGRVLRTNSGIYTVTATDPLGLSIRLLATVRALVPPLLKPPQILSDGTASLVFQDADGGLPFDLSRVQIQWLTNFADVPTTNWQTLNAPFTITNDFVQCYDQDAKMAPRRFYRVLEQ